MTMSEKKKELNKLYKQEHREEILQYHREYYQANKQKMIEQTKKNHERYCEVCKCNVKKYYNHRKTQKHINNNAKTLCPTK